VRDPLDWFDNPNVHLDDADVLAQAAALEPTLLHDGSRVGAAVWIMLVAGISGAATGFASSGEVRSSWPIFLTYLVGVAGFLRVLHPLSTRLLGEAIAWQAVFACFWCVLLAAIAVNGARIDTGWLRLLIVTGGGLFVGLMYGSFAPGFVSREEAWMLSALPLGGLSAWTASSLQRGLDASGSPAWGEAFAGTMAAHVFIIPMAVLMAALTSRASGLAKMATLYLHNPNFLPKAIAYLDQAIALRPRQAEFYNARGIAYSKLGDGVRADADFQRVSELMPRAAEAHMNRGVDFLRRGDFDRAIDTLRRVTTMNPKLATAFSNLGTAYQRNGQLDAAIESFTRAIALRARYPTAYSNRAYSHYLKGDHARAIADATEAIRLDGRLPMAHTNLGHALAATGDVPGAARSFRRALALNPDREVAEETLRALERLGPLDEDEDDEDQDA
jgi:Flp pilus assembly protein TadD